MTDIPERSAHTHPSFPLSDRVKRVVWKTVYLLFFRFSPRVMHGWRAFILRCFGAKAGKGCHIYPRAKIWAPWNLEIGEHASLADDVMCYSMAKITIGKYAVISQGARLITGTHDYEDPGFLLVIRPIRVGAFAWVAAEAFVMPGVSIGKGVVVGARSVVTKDMPEWTVCAGNPCVSLKPRKRRKA